MKTLKILIYISILLFLGNISIYSANAPVDNISEKKMNERLASIEKEINTLRKSLLFV